MSDQTPDINKRRFPWRRWSLRLMAGGALGAYFAGLSVLGILAQAGWDIPSVDTLSTPNRPVSVQIVDRQGRDVLVRGAHAETSVSTENLPIHLKQAVFATEDRRFYHHVGVDPVGLSRAMVTNVKAGRWVQGGSTLSQQLVKNVFLTPDKTLRRKVQEAMLAVWMEHSFSKDEILEKYLNRVYFGAGTWGLEAASNTYFHTPSSDLSVGQSALLVGLLKAPSRFNPSSNPKAAGGRTAIVLASMVDAGYLNREEQYSALTDPIEIRRPPQMSSTNYFVDWIWSDIEDAIGIPKQDIIVQTTLDMAAQQAAANAIEAHLDEERGAEEAAVLMLDGGGGVRAMIGGRNYRKSQFNRAVQASRQPGSAFKPFVYQAAFEAGLTPWDWKTDEPVKIGDWEPGNFTNRFDGVMMLEMAFAKSVNTIAVKLSEELGRDRVIETAGKMGIEDLSPLRSLPLGAQNTTLMTLTSAYLPYANWGDRVTPYGVISISTADGRPLYDFAKPDRTRVMASASLGHMNRVMVETVKQGTGRAAQIKGWDIAGKTGTTNDYRDAWFVGYVPDLVTGVWVGNDDNRAMQKVTGGQIPTRIWHDMMEPVLADIAPTPLPVSERPLRADTQNALDVLLKDIETALP